MTPEKKIPNIISDCLLCSKRSILDMNVNPSDTMLMKV